MRASSVNGAAYNRYGWPTLRKREPLSKLGKNSATTFTWTRKEKLYGGRDLL
jgi:hypothetical protein